MFGNPLTKTGLMANAPFVSAAQSNVQQFGDELANMLACDAGMSLGFDNIERIGREQGAVEFVGYPSSGSEQAAHFSSSGPDLAANRLLQAGQCTVLARTLRPHSTQVLAR